MKKSFADCSKCPFYEKTGNIYKTNIDLKTNFNVDFFIVTQYPGSYDELELILKKHEYRYFITSLSICNDDREKNMMSFDICLKNSMTFLSKCTYTKFFYVGDEDCYQRYFSGISTSSFIENISDFENQFKNLDSLVADMDSFKSEINGSVVTTVDEIKYSDSKNHFFNIPDKFYSDNYRLIDIQHISGQDRLIYIFRDRDNNKIYHEVNQVSDNYYWYESYGQGKIIENHENLKLVIGNYKTRNQNQKCYESDISIDVKHAVDYYLKMISEPVPLNKNILFLDIEIYTYKDKIFPDPERALYPINAISFKYDGGPVHLYILEIEGHIDPKFHEVLNNEKYSNVKVFKNEYQMILEFIRFWRKTDPDFVCGWNVINFDMAYIVNRMKKLSISTDELSPYNNVYVDSKRNKCTITGYVVLDQLILYRNLTYTTETSYKLENICQKELGEGKEKYSGNLNTIYCDDIEKFMDYSLKDTELLSKLEERVQHIAGQDELRKAATTTHSSALSTVGLADGLFMYNLKSQGKASRNGSHSNQKEELPGAYVFVPNGGLKVGLLCDFDFASLYPSIINSWNIGPNTLLMKIPSDIMFLFVYDREKIRNKQFTVELDPIHKSVTKTITTEQLEKVVTRENAILNINGCIYANHEKERSIFYDIISKLFSDRKKFKNMMFDYKTEGDTVNAGIYNCKQMAVKILMNSLYGVLANEHFRFYNINLASSVTLTGQELLKFSAVHCNRFMAGKTGIDLDFQNTVEYPMDYVVYGDTDSIFVYLTDYLKSKKISVKLGEDSLRAVDEIQDYLNKNLLPDCCRLHNVPTERSMISLKNEYLFSKYYSLNAKKKYASKVIAQEGRPLDFIDIKGLEMKRADIPEVSKKLLNEVLSMILSDDPKQNNILNIKNHIKKTEDEVRELCIQGNPYVAKSVGYAKPLSEYKTIPQHMKGMLMWNLLINEDHRHGSRGMLFPILGIDLEKAPKDVFKNYHEKFLKKYKPKDLDVIVIPEELDRLPPYFQVNWKQMMTFAISDRTDLLLEPLVKEVKLLW